jgi:ABC-type nitrate/sulfonate/bicarbonate transport system substrate-binding protein
MGFVEVIQMADLGIEVQGSGLATSRTFIKAHRETVKSAVKAYVEGIHYIFANKQPALKSLARYMRTHDPEVLDYSYQHYLKRTAKKPYPTMKGIQFLLDMAPPQTPQAKTAQPEQFVDLSFLAELETEGFFREMEKKYR